MICHSCGNQIEDNLIICPCCGAVQPNQYAYRNEGQGQYAGQDPNGYQNQNGNQYAGQGNGYQNDNSVNIANVAYNKFCVIGFVLSCIGFVAGYFVVPLAGLIVSAIGLSKINVDFEQGKILGICGIVIGGVKVAYGVIGIILSVFMTFVNDMSWVLY